MTTKIRKLSKKRAKQNREYEKVRDEYLYHHNICERCGGIATEIHHRKSRTGSYLTNTEFFMAVCRPCHLYVEEHSKESYEKGWKILRSA